MPISSGFVLPGHGGSHPRCLLLLRRLRRRGGQTRGLKRWPYLISIGANAEPALPAEAVPAHSGPCPPSHGKYSKGKLASRAEPARSRAPALRFGPNNASGLFIYQHRIRSRWANASIARPRQSSDTLSALTDRASAGSLAAPAAASRSGCGRPALPGCGGCCAWLGGKGRRVQGCVFQLGAMHSRSAWMQWTLAMKKAPQSWIGCAIRVSFHSRAAR